MFLPLPGAVGHVGVQQELNSPTAQIAKANWMGGEGEDQEMV